MDQTQAYAIFAIGGLLLLAFDLRKLRRKLREIAVNDGDQRSKTAQQEWLVVRNLRVTVPIDAGVSAVGLVGLLQQWRLLENEILPMILGVTIVLIVGTSYVWSFRGPPAVLRHWLFDLPTP